MSGQCSTCNIWVSPAPGRSKGGDCVQVNLTSPFLILAGQSPPSLVSAQLGSPGDESPPSGGTTAAPWCVASLVGPSIPERLDRADFSG